MRPWDQAPPGERDVFARFGDGLFVIVPPQPPGPPRNGRPILPTGGAWLHVGADGAIRAFTGKVEVGQGTVHTIALLVAEELRAPIDRVRVLAGDTDLAPWDMGTFGSMGIAVGGALVRAAAARAREILDELAAERGVPAGADRYGELVRGLRRLETVAKPPRVTPAEAWSTAGRPSRDPAAIEAVTGARRFGSDLRAPGMLHGALLHPPAYGASLRRIDAGAARAQGAIVVHEGEQVAVAAATRAQVHAALAALSAEWDEPAQPREAELADYLRAHPSEGEGFWGAMHHEQGDVDRALAVAAIRIDATYTTAYLAHTPLECHVALATWDGERVTVTVGTQTPFMVRDEIALALAIAPARVRVLVPPTGGAFGGKHAADVATAAARLARASGAPVRIAFSREEELAWAYARPMAVIDARAGAAADGTPTAWSFANLNSGANAILPPYVIANQRVDHQPAASPVPQGSYRALAATANAFARESMIDELARAAGVDPLAYRLRHVADERLAAVLRACAERAGWSARAERGWGVAGAIEKEGRIATVAQVAIDAERRVRLVRVVAAYECGAIVDLDRVRAQVEGALVMGLGGAMFEALHVDQGRVVNGALSSYRVPRFSDVPPIEVVLVDRRDLSSAGAGETPVIALAPAIANAIHDASGIRLRTLPLVPGGALPAA